MSCPYPRTIFVNGSSFRVGCGKCLSCQKSKIQSLSFISYLEQKKVYSKGLGCSFVTLTYNDHSLPFVTNTPYVTLSKPDLQCFFKRVRKRISDYNFNRPFRYLAAGEYGSNGSHRPHYHIVFFGLSDVEAEYLTRTCWKDKGLVDVGVLRSGGISYVCKYMTKAYCDDKTRAFYDSTGVQRPFLVHSQNLGSSWIRRHSQDIVSNGYTVFYNGRRLLAPRYVRERVLRLTGVDPRPYVQKYIQSVNKDELEYVKNVELKERSLIAQKRMKLEPVNDFKVENTLTWLCSSSPDTVGMYSILSQI